MSDKVEFPGGWAKLRDPEDVPERLRRPLVLVQERIVASDIGDMVLARKEAGEEISNEEAEKLMRPYIGSASWDDFQRTQYDLLIVALVEEWSFEAPINPESLCDIPGRAYKKLRAACEPLMGKVLGNDEDETALDDANSNLGQTSV